MYMFLFLIMFAVIGIDKEAEVGHTELCEEYLDRRMIY